MSESIAKLRKNFEQQLGQANAQATNLEQALDSLKKQQEQLKGAIRALDVLVQVQAEDAAQAAAAAAATPPAPAADPTQAAADTTAPAPAADAPAPAQSS